MSEPSPFNPLDKRNLGASVAEALLGRKPRPLGELQPFNGAGIYALYYSGPFPAYARLAELNRGPDPQAPIYIGKAIPEGGRKGELVRDVLSTRSLFRRLRDHASSIEATTLRINDFTCRHLVVDDIWIPLGESLLIAKFSPVWNTLVDGFGNHNPGKGRHRGMMPRWDVLHPGREWAQLCEPRIESAEEITREVESRLAGEPSLVRSRFLVEQRRAEYLVNIDEQHAED